MKEEPIYGNDEEAIGRVILQQEKHGAATILEIIDIGEYRVVTYLHNDTDQAMMTFRKNWNSNYEWVQIEKRTGEPLAVFNAALLMEGEEGPSLVFVANAENRAATVQVDVNGFFRKVKLPVDEAGVEWLVIPKAEDNQYSFRFTYLDEAGNIIDAEQNG